MEKIKKFIKENKYTIINVGCVLTLTYISLDAVTKLDICRKEIESLHWKMHDLHNENLFLIQELYED